MARKTWWRDWLIAKGVSQKPRCHDEGSSGIPQGKTPREALINDAPATIPIVVAERVVLRGV